MDADKGVHFQLLPLLANPMTKTNGTTEKLT